MFKSLVFYLLNTCKSIGLLESVRYGCNKPKDTWKEMVWTGAWELESVYWAIQAKSHASLSLGKVKMNYVNPQGI